MKKFIYTFIALLLSASIYAQAPEGFKYQTVARDASGDVMPVLVDFAHGKPIFKIHTDHHDLYFQ